MKILVLLLLSFLTILSQPNIKIESDTSKVNFHIETLSIGLTIDSCSSEGIEMFPSDRIFPKFYADGTVHQTSLSKNTYTRRYIGSLGGVQKILQFYFKKKLVQLSIGATVYSSLVRQPDILEVQTAGYFVDFHVDMKLSESFILRSGYGHYSAHLVDDGLSVLQIESINYAKDYFPVLLAYNNNAIKTSFYGGFRFDTYTIPEKNKRWNFQIGFQGGDFQLTNYMKLYGAVDIKFKQEVAFATTQSYQIGLKFWEQGSSAIRFAYTYRTGIEDRGQFYKNRVSLSLVSLYFDF